MAINCDWVCVCMFHFMANNLYYLLTLLNLLYSHARYFTLRGTAWKRTEKNQTFSSAKPKMLQHFWFISLLVRFSFCTMIRLPVIPSSKIVLLFWLCFHIFGCALFLDIANESIVIHGVVVVISFFLFSVLWCTLFSVSVVAPRRQQQQQQQLHDFSGICTICAKYVYVCGLLDTIDVCL